MPRNRWKHFREDCGIKMGSPYKHWKADEKIDGVEERSDTIHGRLVDKSVILELRPHESTCGYDIGIFHR